MKVALSLAVLLAAAGVATAEARADGLPVLGVDVGSTGVVSRAHDARYVALGAERVTVVARVNPRGGRVLRSTVLPGTFTIPAVAYDGSAGGLSADGRTLVLIEPRAAFPRARTTLAVLDARRLRVRALIRLRGDFSFDAVSPAGAWLYLIQYVAPRDPTRYLVRAYDLRAGRLLDEPVTDPRNRSEKMRGSPLTRASSPDGRWAYTLYDGGGRTPFIHALDTRTRTARCIDLDGLARNYVSALRLALDPAGATLTVRHGGEAEAVVDTRTFEVSTPPEASAGAPTAWLVLALTGAAVLFAAAVLGLSLRRRRRLVLTAQVRRT